MTIEWKKLRETYTKVGYRKIINKFYKLPNGQEAEYTIIDAKPGGSMIFALNENNQVVIARHYRPGQDAVLSDLPGGMIEPGTTPEETAIRELYEETGYEAAEIILLGHSPPNAYIEGEQYCFLATGCKQIMTTPKNDETEFIEVTTLPIEQVERNAYTGKMTETIGVLFALRELEKRGIYKSAK